MKSSVCYWRFAMRLAATLVAAISTAGCHPGETGAAQVLELPQVTPVIVREVAQVSARDVVYVSGALEADKTAPLGFLVPGKVEHVHVDEGDPVNKGQVLAAVEKDDYQSHLDIMEAGLMRAQDAFDRFQPLYKEGAFAEKNFIELKSGLMQAKASRNIALKKLQDTMLRSPINGIVGTQNVELGQMVSPEVPVFIVVKTDRIFARVPVPESEIGQIFVGQSSRVSIPALDDRVVVGTVSLVGAVADPRTRTYTAKILLPNSDYSLRPGMMAQARIMTDVSVNMLSIPGQAVVRDADNLTYVFVANADTSRALRRRVFPGGVRHNEIEIRQGLEPGDRVIVSGQHRLNDGDLISLAEGAHDMKGAK